MRESPIHFGPGHGRRSFRALLLLGCIVLACCASINASETSSSYESARADWEKNMVQFGHKWGRYLNPTSGHDEADQLQATYYDAAWVFYRISDYARQQEPWYTYAARAIDVYRGGYLEKAGYSVPGYWRFPHGLVEDVSRGGGTSGEAIRLIRDRPAFSNLYELRSDSGYYGNWEAMSREVAYVIQANIAAERHGLDRVLDSGVPRLEPLIGFVEVQLHEWRTQQFASPDGGRFAPFMFGLTAHALIEFYEWEVENGRDPNAMWPGRHWADIVTALEDVSAWAFRDAKVRSGRLAGESMWVPSYKGSGGLGAFRYDDTASGSQEIAPDLNLLVAPVYAWLYKSTGNRDFRDMGDAVFSGGVRNASVGWNGKIFNQNYRWSFDFIRWREEAPGNAGED